MTKLFKVLLALLLIVGFAGGCDDSDIKYWEWNLVELGPETGALCGNGSPYKFFINPSDTSDNVLIYIEAGGACWDYPSCSGAEGIRGAANPNGIPDDYMDIGTSVASLMSPFVFRDHPWDAVPTNNWTIIFVPYCTGDVHTGSKDITYYSDTGEALNWHHRGHDNIMAILDWMITGKFSHHFDNIPKLMVTGCSAGGAGSIINYHFIRQALGSRVGQAYLLDDSGPIYPALDENQDTADTGGHTYAQFPHSLPLHRTIRAVWGIDDSGILNELVNMEGSPFTDDDFGSLNAFLSWKYPNDRLAHTQFSMDGNYSSYSYERFYPVSIAGDLDVIHEYWQEDEGYLMDLYDTTSNMGYFIPWYRPFNESHCTCVLSFDDTDIQDINMDMKDYIHLLLNDNIPMSELRKYEGFNWSDTLRPYWGWELVDLLMGLL